MQGAASGSKTTSPRINGMHTTNLGKKITTQTILKRTKSLARREEPEDVTPNNQTMAKTVWPLHSFGSSGPNDLLVGPPSNIENT